MNTVGKPIAPFRKPNYFSIDWSVVTNILDTLGETAGSIFAASQQTKQVQAQTQAAIEEAKARAAEDTPVVLSGASDGKNSVILIVIVAVVVLIVIGLILWAILRK